jgi:hypothetical protein
VSRSRDGVFENLRNSAWSSLGEAAAGHRPAIWEHPVILAITLPFLGSGQIVKLTNDFPVLFHQHSVYGE